MGHDPVTDDPRRSPFVDGPTLLERLRARSRGSRGRIRKAATPRRVTYGIGLAGVALVDLGVGLIYAPGGVIAAGLSLVGIVTVDPEELRWPR